MKLYKHVYNTKTKIDTIEFEVTESPKLYTVVDKNIIHSVWEKKIKKEDVGVFRGTSLFSYNMITTTPDPTPFIKALINREENYEKHLKIELEDCVHRRAQFLTLLTKDDSDNIYDGITINCPECGKEITIEFNTARCDKCDWFAADAELDEIMNED